MNRAYLGMDLALATVLASRLAHVGEIAQMQQRARNAVTAAKLPRPLPKARGPSPRQAKRARMQALREAKARQPEQVARQERE